MREIKLRAWNKKSKEMIYSPKFRSWDNVKGVSMFDLYSAFLEPEIILMQYTGLKDKNGKDIYEGDILQRPDHGYSSLAREYVVVWSNVASSFIVQQDGKYMSHLSQFMAAERSATDDKEEKEKIGNIYENPELLK